MASSLFDWTDENLIKEMKITLEQNDHDLFCKGACHVFAITLQEQLQEEGYELKRFQLSRSKNDIEKAHHIYAFRKGFIIDINGIKSEKEYILCAIEPYITKHGRICPPKTETFDTSAEEILEKSKKKHFLNKWELFVDDGFIRKAKDRALEFIKSKKTNFLLSKKEIKFEHI
jgi:hypothetical protein